MHQGRRPRDDGDDGWDDKQPRARSFFGRVSSWVDGRSRGGDRGQSVDRQHGESSRGRYRHQINADASPPPGMTKSPPDERRALNQL
jgi:hypothetical protein